jgi:hypothetical protein
MIRRHPFEPADLGTEGNPFELRDVLAIARELEAYAEATRPAPCVGLVDRVMEAIAAEPLPAPVPRRQPRFAPRVAGKRRPRSRRAPIASAPRPERRGPRPTG